MLRLIGQSIGMGLQSIRSNRVRSFLTMLGIVIGVGAVISLVTIVQGAMDKTLKQYESLGTGTMQVKTPGTALKVGISEAEMDSLCEAEGVAAITPTAELTATAEYEGTIYKKISVKGYNASYFQHNDAIRLGRGFYANEAGGDVNVCVVDKTFVRKVMNGQKNVIGKNIQLNGYTYTIIGIQKDDESVMSSLVDTSSLDGSMIIPYQNAAKMSGESHNITSMYVYVSDGYTNNFVEQEIRRALANIYNDDDNAYYILNYETLVKQMNQVKSTLTGLMGGIAAIALVVGGIGIMNMMLVTVTERTKEIGLRKALGAEPIRIQLEFLLEAVMLSIFGGAIGVGAGIGISYVAAQVMQMEFKIIPGAIMVGACFSIGVGVIFGWAPASRASHLNPIDALRSE